MSALYLHYPCLLLATETKYFKAEKASQPTGLLLPILLPAQGRGCKGSFELQSTMWADSSLVPGGLAMELVHPQVNHSGVGPQPPTLPLLPWKPYPEHLTCLYADYCWQADLQKPEFRKPTLLPCTPGDCKDAQALTPLIQTLEK